jgi:hypothetical protein
MEVKEVIHRKTNAQLLKVILQKTPTGKYNWEVHFQGSNLDEILSVLRKADLAMRKEYGGQ